MLVACPECTKEISDSASSCPHCGHPIKDTLDIERGIAEAKKNARSGPIFLILAIVAFLVMLGTPMLLIFLPLFGTIALSIISIFRKEKGAAFSWVIMLFAVLIWAGSGSETLKAAGSTHDAEVAASSAKLSDVNWSADPSFGTGGSIIYNVEVTNTSNRNIDLAKVEFTTYDKAGKLVTSDFTYVKAIPAGGKRTDKSYADYYGTEENAQAVVTEVHFGN